MQQTAKTPRRMARTAGFASLAHHIIPLGPQQRCSASTVAHASNPDKPEPGATRKGTARDASRLAKIFGPSRYPAFVPDESLLGSVEPPPAPANPASAPSTAPGTLFAGRKVRPSRPSTSSGAPSKAGTAGKGAGSSATAVRPSQAAGVISQAKHWRELQPVVAVGNQLGAPVLVLLAKRLEQLTLLRPPASESELQELRSLGEQLASATRMYVGASLSLRDLSVLLRALATVTATPTENWLLAVELASMSAMQQAVQQYQRDVAAAGGEVQAAAAEPARLKLLQSTQEVLQLAAGLLAVGYQPREQWLQLYYTCTHGALLYVAEQVQSHMKRTQERSVVTNLRAPRAAGLIAVPEQVAPDQVTTADGTTVDVAASQPAAPATPAPPAADCSWESVVQFQAAEWAALSQSLLMWQLPVEDEWTQAYLDASYGALACTRAVVTKELDPAATASTAGDSASVCILDSSVIADMATSLLMSGSRPSENWVTLMETAAAAVLQRVAGSDGRPGPSSRFSAQPTAIVNLMLVSAECGRPVEQPWVETALLAAAADEASGVRTTGDQLAALLWEAGRAGWEMPAHVVSAATVVANRAQALWERQQEVERMRANQGQRAQEAMEDTTGFSARGLALMLLGLSRLGGLQLMSSKWMLCWGEQAVLRSQEFDLGTTIVTLQAASDAGAVLPARAVHVLGGQALEALHRASSKVSRGQLGGGGKIETGGEQKSEAQMMQEEEELRIGASAESWLELLRGLSGQALELPVPWLGMIQDLTVWHSQSMGPTDLLVALQVLDRVPEAADPGFLHAVVERYRQQGGLSTPEGCVSMAGVLVGVVADAAVLQEVDAAAVACFPSQCTEDNRGALHWAAMFAALCIGGHLPSPQLWEGMIRAVSDPAQLSLNELCQFLVSYNTVRMTHPEESQRLGAAWSEALAVEAGRRVSQCDQQEEILTLLGAMATLDRVWEQSVLQDVERATLDLQADLKPSAVSACIVMFTRAQVSPSAAWCAAAVAALQSQLAAADAQDLIALLVGCRRLPPLQQAVPATLLAGLLDAAGRLASANEMVPDQLAALFTAARELKEAGVKVLSPQSGAAAQGIAALLERAQSMRQIFSTPEMCELIRSVRALNIKPGARWLAAMLSQLEVVDLLEAGPEAVVYVAVALEGWAVDVSPALYRSLCECLARLVTAGVGARQMLDADTVGEGEDLPKDIIQDQLILLVSSSLQLLQALVNLDTQLPLEDQVSLAGHSQQIWPDLASLLSSGDVPPQLHEILLYSAARLAAARDAAGGQAVAAAVAVPQQALQPVVAAITRQHLGDYTPQQLGMVFSAGASVGLVMPEDWMSLFWEYSRPQLSAYPLEMLVAVVSGVGRVGATHAPPRVWEEALYESLAAVAQQCSVQDVNSVLKGLLAAGLKPPAHVLQALLDGALSSQQTAAARLAAARAADSQAPQPAAANGASAAPAAPDSQLVRSTRSTARRPAASQPAGGSAVQASIAARAADAAAAQQAVTLGQVVAQVVVEYGYLPDASWLATCQEALKPALNSSHISLTQRSELANLMKELTTEQQ